VSLFNFLYRLNDFTVFYRNLGIRHWEFRQDFSIMFFLKVMSGLQLVEGGNKESKSFRSSVSRIEMTNVWNSAVNKGRIPEKTRDDKVKRFAQAYDSGDPEW